MKRVKDLIMSNFVHLHVHTQYSILDGASKVSKLIEKAIEYKMPAIAITDHGNLFGVKDFHKKASAKGIKPIIGCEVYVARRSRFDKDKDTNDRSGDHLILLAKNLIGYKNLIKIVSLSWIEGFYGKPRIDKDLLFANKEGIIVSTACIAGTIPRAIRNGKIEEAEQSLLEYKEQFNDDFYLEIMRHPTTDPNADQSVFPQQEIANKGVIELSKKHNVKVIATNDVHFINAEDADAHDRLICINTGVLVKDPNRLKYTKQEYLKPVAEMEKLFVDIPEAISNTVELAEKVEQYSIDYDPIMPVFEIPTQFENSDEYLKHITYEGAKERYTELTPEIKERIDFELETVKRMGYPDYFLIVWDFIKTAREMGIWVGPGRGSAAGSVVSYCLKITNLDPILYGLLFERFLNPDRISMPDIDIDFDEDGREKILKWVEEKYGHNKVANIITFGTMAAKMAIRDVARVQDIKLSDANNLTKMIPDGITELSKAYKASPELKKARESGEKEIQSTLKYAETLEGSVRQTGLHACGIIIGREDLINYIPLCVSKESNLLVTQFEGQFLEEVGMLKMDFLGLKTLSINKDAVEIIRNKHNVTIDLETIPLDDKKTYDLYSKGNTVAVFQFESPGMRKYLKELKPNRFEDLIAMNALYRPGPIEYIPSFINRKHKREEIKYDLPEMQEYLEETYGITVYQEQVMLLSQKLAGFTKGDADTLRKAMGKKLRAALDKMKTSFIEGCKKNGHDIKICEKIWTDWESFALYAFNKSHSTCYAYLSYQTAYLKAHYPAEFMAANLSRNLDNIKEITKLMEACKQMGLNVLGPDVNESDLKFNVVQNKTIRFGLAAVKNVGESAAKAIIEERNKNGKYSDLFNFFERIPLTVVNKRTIEALVLSGGFDSFEEIKRHQFFANDNKDSFFIDTLIKYGSKFQQDKGNNQLSLFGDSIAVEISKPSIPEREPWSNIFQLNKEKDLIGLFISAHPLDPFRFEIENLTTNSLSELHDLKPLLGREISFAGFVTSQSTFSDKNGNPYGRFQIEDFSDSFQITLFNKNFIAYSNYFQPGIGLFIKADIQTRMYGKNEGNEIDLNIKSIMMLSEVKKELIKKITLQIPLKSIKKTFITDLENICSQNKGPIRLSFNVYDVDSGIKLSMLSRKYAIQITNQLIDFIEDNPDISFRIN